MSEVITRVIPGTAWSVEVRPWHDAFQWAVTDAASGYTYSSVGYGSAAAAEGVALWHIVQRQQRDVKDEALAYAISIIESYEMDIRGRPELIEQGFCQGVVYRDAIQRIHEILGQRKP